MTTRFNYMLILVLGAMLCSRCGKDGGTHPDPDAGFHINLNRHLHATGDFILVNRIITVRVANGRSAGNFVALSGICTHDGCTVAGFDRATGTIYCNCNNCVYGLDGASLRRDGNHPLRMYNVTLVNDSTLIVKGE